ncbi:MAG TPA: hypothetical protein VF614_16945, partial [Chthoniobacteraceae bacterium]
MSRFHAYEESSAWVVQEWELEVLPHGQFDDRRSNARLYQAWTDMLRGRACPSIEDLEPIGVAGPRDILIDLRSGIDDPELTCVGGALIADCGARGLKRLSEAPAGSYLALLAAHYRYAAMVRHPIAFQGQRAQPDGERSSYRGILLPFSSDGKTVDFVQGRISWLEPAGRDICDRIRHELERALEHQAAG